MTIQIGSQNVASLYVGTTPVSKAYLGTTQIYPTTASQELLPLGNVTFGAFVGVIGDGPPTSQQFATYSQVVGRMPKIVHCFERSFEQWIVESHNAPYPGQIPMVTWEPGINADWSQQSNILSSVINGDFDAELNDRAANCITYGKPVIFRPMHEMNGFWYPWSGPQNGSNIAATTLYKQAYIHVYNLFQAAGANNVKFYFCVNNYSTTAGGGVNDPSWNDMLNYYPGNQYVDYIGADVYNFAKNDPNVGSFSSLYNEFHTKFGGIGKPVIIGETGCADVGTGAGDSTYTYVSGSDVNKASWLTDMSNSLDTQYQNIVAVVFFNIDKERRWQVDSSAGALSAFQSVVTGPRWIDAGGAQVATSSKIATLQTNLKTMQTTVFRYDSGISAASDGTHIIPGVGTYPTFKTFDTFDFTSSSFYIKTTPPTGASGVTLQIAIDPGVGYGNDILVSFDNGNATVARRSDYNWVDIKTPWAFTSGSYIRFSESGGVFTVSDSPNAVAWTNRVTIDVGPNPVDNAILSVLAYASSSGGTNAILSNLNTTS